MEKEKTKLVIFDYDDTLIKRDLKRVFSKIKSLKEFIVFVQADIQRTKNIHNTLRNAFRKFNLNFGEEDVNLYAKEYIKEFTEGKIKKEVKKVLTNLSKKSTLVILSGGSKKTIIKELKKNGVLPLFDDIITTKDTGYKKPSVYNFLYILRKYDIKPAQVVSVGNSYTYDIKPARQLGIKTVWITNYISDFSLEKLEDLTEEDILNL